MELSLLHDTDIPVIDAYLDALISGVPSPAKVVSEELNIKQATVYSKINRNKVYIREKVDAYFQEASIDKLKVLQEVKNIAFFNIVDMASFNGESMDYEAWNKLPREITACIKDVTVNYNEKTGARTVHFSFYDKQKSIDQLIKMLEIGADKVKVEHSGKVEFKERLFDNVLEDKPSN